MAWNVSSPDSGSVVRSASFARAWAISGEALLGCCFIFGGPALIVLEVAHGGLGIGLCRVQQVVAVPRGAELSPATRIGT